ncbi:MAG: hypothetical protein JXL80_16425 [Planctomycetes bacterium]|nr:hypothetical protein [Planctomycetota bacterium]
MASRITALRLDDSRRKLTVSLVEGLPDADRYTFALTDLLRTAGGDKVVSSMTVKLLAGDVDCSGVVTRADMLAVRQVAGQPLNSGNAHLDVDDSGVVTTADMMAVRSRLGRSLPEP